MQGCGHTGVRRVAADGGLDAAIANSAQIPNSVGEFGGFGLYPVNSCAVADRVTQNGAASLTDGFPPLTFVPSVAGGLPPFGADLNGILKQLSQWDQWQAAGGPIFYNSRFATSIGGYPNGAMLNSAVTPGTIWMSTADNNMTNPDAINGNQIVGGSNWVQAPWQMPIGTPIQSFASAPHRATCRPTASP